MDSAQLIALAGVITAVIGGGGLAGLLLNPLKAYSSALTDLREHGDAQELRIDRLSKRVDHLTHALASTESRARRAESELAMVHLWIRSGAEPPPPPWPDWLHLPMSHEQPPTHPMTPPHAID